MNERVALTSESNDGQQSKYEIVKQNKTVVVYVASKLQNIVSE